MSVGYVAVQWNRHKRVYDACVIGGIGVYLAGFLAVSRAAWPGTSPEILVIRGLGSCAIVLLHVILCIGPLARLDRRFLPLLYNRRHLGVMTFLVALAHGVLVVGYYHGFGVVGALESLLSTNREFGSVSGFPFQVLGVLGLGVMFAMAATSHDFWLRNMGAAAWKRLHMVVYGAYGVVVAHVGLGAMQGQRGPMAGVMVTVGAVVVASLHLVSGWRERRRDAGAREGEWIDAGEAVAIPMDRARVVCAPGGERIAVFRHDGGISAVTNVCAHQGGPLGEGKVVDGCITCPWHGWQYRPGDGCSPPPFTEKIATYQVRVMRGRVEVNARALAPGTAVTPARVEGGRDG